MSHLIEKIVTALAAELAAGIAESAAAAAVVAAAAALAVPVVVEELAVAGGQVEAVRQIAALLQAEELALAAGVLEASYPQQLEAKQVSVDLAQVAGSELPHHLNSVDSDYPLRTLVYRSSYHYIAYG